MDWTNWSTGGVNKSIPHYAGPVCAGYLNPTWRFIETILVLIFATWLFRLSYTRLSVPLNVNTSITKEHERGRMVLLVLLCLIWGMEIGYKFSSRTAIYLLMPCHITTALQIYLLAASPSKTVTSVFRFHLNLLNGPLLAFMFPEADTRLFLLGVRTGFASWLVFSIFIHLVSKQYFPLEFATYWIQHALMIIVPYYLLHIGGVFDVENFNDFSWNGLSYSINVIYHFAFLQYFAIPTQVNLNHMLCPALADPFAGQFYRTCAVFHQALLCPILCKLYCFISFLILRKSHSVE